MMEQQQHPPPSTNTTTTDIQEHLFLRSGLNETTATRFDYLHASATSSESWIIWITWAIEASIVGVFTLVFFLGILSSKRARNRSYNVYVLFITAPDMFFSFACAVTCALSAASNGYYSDQMCSFQSFYVTFSFTTNAWLNAVILRQVHIMLQSSYQRRRYKPPTIPTVCKHAAVVYVFAAIISSIPLYQSSLLQYAPARGIACLPLESDIRSSLFFWLFYYWMMMGIPLTYVVYVFYDVKRRNLLPPGGRTRTIAIFFSRITLVFVIMWLPTMISIYMTTKIEGPWFGYIGGVWSHLQPLVSASVACLKDDIGEAVKNFVCCNYWWKEKKNNYSQEEAEEEEAEEVEKDGDDDEEESVEPNRRNPKRRSSVFDSFLFWRNISTTTNLDNIDDESKDESGTAAPSASTINNKTRTPILPVIHHYSSSRTTQYSEYICEPMDQLDEEDVSSSRSSTIYNAAEEQQPHTTTGNDNHGDQTEEEKQQQQQVGSATNLNEEGEGNDNDEVKNKV